MVAQHFAETGAVELPHLDVANVDGVLEPVASLADLEAGRIGITQKVLVGMRGSYGGVLMFGLITTMMGDGPGQSDLDRRRSPPRHEGVPGRQGEPDPEAACGAKAAIRRFADDASFQVGKESKDRLRSIQRLLRDHFSAIAEQALRSINDSLRGAQEAANLESTERTRRIAQLEKDLHVASELKQQAAQLVAGDAGAVTA